jgi:hypothetical protein
VHLVGCIRRKFVTMHGHMNIKFMVVGSICSIQSTRSMCYSLLLAIVLFYSWEDANFTYTHFAYVKWLAIKQKICNITVF